MRSPHTHPRYNQPIPQMRARTSRGLRPGRLRPGWLSSLFLAIILFPSTLHASSLGDTARQLAQKIASASGPGAFALDVSNRSSLDEKSAREIRAALEAQLQVEGVHAAKTEEALGAIAIVLSESLREYVWTAEISIGSDEKKVVLVSLPRPLAAMPFASAPPVVVKTTLLFAQPQLILDVALVDMPGGSRLIVLGDSSVAIYHQQGLSSSGHWQLESSFAINHSRTFPRDLRGRLLLQRDHLFDIYLPGTSCRTNSIATAPLTLSCNDTDDPWPLTAEDNGVRAFFAGSRNFFTGALSPGIGKIANVPAFYSGATIPRTNYALWLFATVDGSLHLVDGMTDQLIAGAKWGSDLAAVRSNCGTGTQVLATESGDDEHDGVRAFEIPDRDPVQVSSLVEFDGRIVALWPDTPGNNATAVVKRKGTGWYEAYRVSITCGN
jgi:hypothetical protein